MFDEAGGFDGTMTLWTGSNDLLAMELVRDQLHDNLGLTDVEVHAVEFGAYSEGLDGGGVTGPYLLGWIMDYPSPQNYLESLLHTDGTSNYSGWSDERFDRLVDQGNTAPTVEQSLSFYAHAQDVAVSAMPHVPLFFEKAAVAHSDRVLNVSISPTGRVN